LSPLAVEPPDAARFEPEETSAETLALRAKEGCRRSFAQLVDRLGPRLLRYLHDKTGNCHDAEDLVQEAFIKAWHNLSRYQPTWRFSTWLFTIAARLAASHYRGLRPSVTLPAMASTEPEPSEALAEEESRQRLWSLARRLPAGQFEALWLRYAEDMSAREIARVMGNSEIHVRVLLYRARTKLAALWSQGTVPAMPREGRSEQSLILASEGTGAK
jgi:RNA polymerase sigma-70 factor, ECF subfamily